MKAMFSTQQQQVGKLGFAGRTAIGVVAAVAMSVAAIAGLSQQTGCIPVHWSAANRAAMPVVAAGKADMTATQSATASRKTTPISHGRTAPTQITQIAQSSSAGAAASEQ